MRFSIRNLERVKVSTPSDVTVGGSSEVRLRMEGRDISSEFGRDDGWRKLENEGKFRNGSSRSREEFRNARINEAERVKVPYQASSMVTDELRFASLIILSCASSYLPLCNVRLFISPLRNSSASSSLPLPLWFFTPLHLCLLVFDYSTCYVSLHICLAFKKASIRFEPFILFKAGIQFLEEMSYSQRADTGAPICLAAVLEYLTAEVLDLAGNAARDYRKSRIIPRHVLLAVRNDEDLGKLLACVTIAHGGGIVWSLYGLYSNKMRKNSKFPLRKATNEARTLKFHLV
ncbi:hypothetical protein M5K25_008949 [Dendrobium thyrsiflorum]|uniref:Histone H2A n=1 Tax=Dendrobium thyrsiflorum TaxID=117978 RepID=A0ABD0VGX2_DENTH